MEKDIIFVNFRGGPILYYYQALNDVNALVIIMRFTPAFLFQFHERMM